MTSIDPQGLNRRLRRYLRHGMLPQLAAFDSVMRLGSVTRTAEALAMAQPTVSGHLRKLSEAVGLALFETRGRQLVPTAAAWALHAAVAEMFDSLARVDGVLGAMRDELAPGGQERQGRQKGFEPQTGDEPRDEPIRMPPVQIALPRGASVHPTPALQLNGE
jgi:DNA-binding transcriptional LysR family regulator